MSFTNKLKSLKVAPDTMATLTYSEGTDVFLMNEDEVELLEEEFDEGTQRLIDEFINIIDLGENND